MHNPPPTWLTWSYPAKHLQPSFHSSPAHFESFIKWLRSCPYRSPLMVAYSKSFAVTMCLGVGLVLRDLHFRQFKTSSDDEDSSNGGTSTHAIKSVLNWGHYQALLSACRDIRDDMEICFDLTPGDTAAMPPSSIQHAPVGNFAAMEERKDISVHQDSSWDGNTQGGILCNIQMDHT